VWVDPGKHVREVDRSNNTLRITDPLCAPKPPDIDLRLATAQVLAITNPDGSTEVDIEVLIKNEGTDPSGAFQLAATCQGVTKVKRVGSVGPGEYTSLDVAFAPDDKGSDPSSGALIDPNDKIKETDELNNGADITDPQCAPAP